MKSKVRIIKKPTKASKELDKISMSMIGPNKVKVGFPKGSNAYPDGTSVITVAAVHEFGSPRNNVPERSFLRSTVRKNRLKYKLVMRKLAQKMIDGELTLEKALGLLGTMVASDVQTTIRNLKTPPLKHREGNPLIDTAHMIQSVTYQVGSE